MEEGKELQFDLPKGQSNIIKVIGVGGGGSNAVNHMYEQGIKDVDFIVCNTDKQALDISPVPIKIQLGSSLTEGLGAGSISEVGRNAAIESIEEVRELLSKNTKMLFVTAGMGGGTGTGAAPIIATTAKEMGILTVGIVTMPFGFEGRKRKNQADEGIEAFRKAVDALVVINNDKLRMLYGNLTIRNAFTKADDVLTVAAKGIAETITGSGYMNVDFNDVKTVMTDGGVAIMGTGIAEGEDRAIKAVETSLSSPLLNDNDITGAKYVLMNITYGDKEVQMDEISDITDYLQDAAGETADVIWGCGNDDTLGDKLSVTIVATGFSRNTDAALGIEREPKKTVHTLEDPSLDAAVEIVNPISSPIENLNKTEEPFLKTNEIKAPVNNSPIKDTNENVASERIVYQLDDDQSEPSLTKDVEPLNEPAQVELTFDVENTSNIVEEEIIFIEEEKEISPNQSNEVLNSDLEVDNTDESPKKVYSLDDNYDNNNSNEIKDVELSKHQMEDAYKKRLAAIKLNTEVLKTPSGIVELEKTPAYLRRKIELDDVPHSSENNSSRYTVSKKDGNKGGLRSNNSFLHDNVD